MDPEVKTPPQETRATGEGMFHPPPRQPHPQGAISHRHTAREEYNLSAVDAITLTEIPSPHPGTVSGLSPRTARPLWRGREEAAAAAGRWGWLDCSHGKTSPVTRRRQGRGLFIPLPRQPLPGGDIPSIECQGGI